MTDRRTFLTMIGAGAGMIAFPAAAAGPDDDMIIVNALGGFSNPNGRRSEGAIQGVGPRMIEPRVLVDARASGMTAVNETIGYVAGDMEPFEHSMREIGLWEARLRNHPDRLIKVVRSEDILRARLEGKIGVILGFQNAAMVGDDASRIDIFADMGIRVIQLTYNLANQIGDGSMAPGNRGITPFGREVIERLNANKVMVDLSHSGQQTCLDAARASKQPISINHTGCRALTDRPRNKSDEELRLVAERGGFVGIYFMPYLNPTSVATPEDVVAHIEHAVKICGEDHVGIGTDGGTTAIDDMPAYRREIAKEIAARKAAGIGATGENPDTVPFVEGLTGPHQFRTLIRMLRARGHSTARIEKIMGRNFVDYARRIWDA